MIIKRLDDFLSVIEETYNIQRAVNAKFSRFTLLTSNFLVIEGSYNISYAMNVKFLRSTLYCLM